MKLQGIFPAITTPFDHNGDLYKVKVQHNIEKWNRTGLAGYVVCGSTGESVYLTTEEKLQLWEWVAQYASSEKILIAGTGVESVRETVALTVMAGVATTYFQALEYRDRVSVAEKNLASAERILRGLKLEQSVGTANALDVAQEETVVATLAAGVPALRQQLRQSIDALAVLLGETPESLSIAATTLEPLVAPEVTAGLPSELLARRPDVAEAEADLIAANANVQVARASFFPSISLTGSGGFESSALTNLFTPANRVWAATAGLTQPIFAGGALRGQSQYAKARYSELLANYHKSVISAFANVEDSLVAVRESAEQQVRQQHAVDEAARAYRIAQAQLRAGTINVVSLLNTQSALFTAQDTLAQVRFQRLQASVNLFKALGGGWQDGRGERSGTR